MKYLALSIPGPSGTIKIDDPTGLPSGVPTGGLDTLDNAIGVGIQIVIIIAICFVAFTLAHAAVSMITSGGDKQRFQSARERLRWAIIGLIVIFLSFGLVNLLGTFFGVGLFSFYK